jgi:hypothetical protein
VKQESLIIYKKDHALINISEAKEHSTNNGFPCEAHEAFYKAILKRYK